MDAGIEAPPRRHGAAWIALAILALAQGLVLLAFATFATPLTRDAPLTAFSEARARVVLERLVPAPVPRPIGSAENAAFRDRLVAELRMLGLEPEHHVVPVMSPRGTFAVARNVIAIIDGSDPTADLVLLEAHHDSVAAGPGVADDASGVACLLEIARALRAGPPPRRGVVLLFDDGEESGLLGARGFAASHPLRDRIEAFVVLEARGTEGPSALWRLSEGDSGSAPLVRLASRALPRPVTSSALASLAARLPNDTDLTAFRAVGWRGFDLAFAGGLPRYHSVADTLDALDRRTLQHQGASGLALTRALVESGLPAEPAGSVAWTDVLGCGVLTFGADPPWPWLRPLLMLVPALGACALLRRRRGLRWGRVALAAGAWPACAAAALGAGWLVARAEILISRSTAPATAWPGASWAAVALGAFAAALAIAALMARRTHVHEALAGACLAGIALASVVGALDAGLAIVLEPGAWIGTLSLVMVAGLSGRPGTRVLAAAAAPLLVAAVVALELGHALFIMSGSQLPLLAAAAPALVAGWLVPFAAARAGRAVVVVALASIGMLVAAALLPSFDARSPRHLNLLHLADPERGMAWWVAERDDGDPLPDAMLRFADFAPRALEGWPGARGTPLAAPAPALALEGPRVEVLSDVTDGATRRVSLRVTSSPGSLDVVVLGGEGDAKPVAVEGLEVPAAALAMRRVRIAGGAPDGVVVDVSGAAGPLEVFVTERRPGLPPEGRSLLEARPTSASPSHEGDRTHVLTRLSI